MMGEGLKRAFAAAQATRNVTDDVPMMKIGTMVRLKSSGPAMMVFEARADGLIACEWFVGGDLRRDAFDAANLELVSS
jgi:uncharacterized protein YodC (DUF2158 family)